MSLRRHSALLSCFTVTVTIILAFGIDRYRKSRIEQFDGPRVPLRASYVPDDNNVSERISFYPRSPQIADTTAVILNWSRLPNVVRIVGQLCDQSLDNTIATIVVWNNSPRTLSQEVCTLICILLDLIGCKTK